MYLLRWIKKDLGAFLKEFWIRLANHKWWYVLHQQSKLISKWFLNLCQSPLGSVVISSVYLRPCRAEPGWGDKLHPEHIGKSEVDDAGSHEVLSECVVDMGTCTSRTSVPQSHSNWKALPESGLGTWPDLSQLSLQMCMVCAKPNYCRFLLLNDFAWYWSLQGPLTKTS